MRFLDLMLSIVLGLVLLPIALIIALLIVLSSGWPILYKQERVGRFGKNFTLLKFRTMSKHSDKFGLLTIGNADQRITRIGGFLRRFKLDELPQLWNVLIGDMSFVGPRPEVQKYVKIYTPVQLQILNVRPGITDEASIYYRHESQLLSEFEHPEKAYVEQLLPHKIELSMPYVQQPNVKQYFKLLFKTFYVLFK